MASFSIPLSGLEADSTALNTIANNLANLNTTAFKAQDTTFSDLFYQQIGTSGSGDPITVGAGTQVASTATDFSNGSMSSTGNNSDVALNGDGFFVVENSSGTEYTRDGSFNVSPDGFLTTEAGLQVMGYPAINGVVNTNAPLAPLQIPVGEVESPRATQNMSITANLDANTNAAASTGFLFDGTLGASSAGQSVGPITVYDSNGAAHSLTVNLTNEGATVPNQWGYSIELDGNSANAVTGTLNFSATTGAITSSTPINVDFSGLSDGANPLALSWNPSDLTQIAGSTNTISGAAQVGGVAAASTPVPVTVELYDSLGNPQTATVTFSRDANAQNAWDYSVALPAGSYGGTASSTATGSLGFNSDGVLTTINGVPASASNSTIALKFPGLADGASDLNFNWNLYNASGQATITQVATASGASATSQDGYAGGQYTGYTIDQNGIISAKFSNDQTTAVGQLAIATVTNEQGLARLGDNNYGTTEASGEASIGVAGSGGRGTIQDGALEASNVDISTEFSDLIVAQRAFEANSKAVTTFDTVAQETINMIH